MEMGGTVRELHPTDSPEFAATIESLRPEIRLHCYRMLGSFHDADDLAQETLLRAWRRKDTYAGRGSLKAWVYKIATNACLDELAHRPRRLLPQEATAPSDPAAPHALEDSALLWLEPYPDHLLPDPAADPEARVAAADSVRLAFLVALQTLSPRQRAVLLLRDVLAFGAREVANLLDLTVSSVNSLLHRARVRMSKRYRPPPLAGPSQRHVDDLLQRYVRAWETADIAGFIALLREDARFAMPPSPAWFLGREAIGAFARAVVFANNARWHLSPTKANGQPAFAVYGADETSVFRGRGIQVLTLESEGIAEATTFMNPGLLGTFGLPDTISPSPP